MADYLGRLSQVTAQVVTRSTGSSGVESGATVGLTSLIAQTVSQGVVRSTRVDQLVSHVISTTTPKSVRAAQIAAQVLIQSGVNGGWVRDSALYPQVLYTIGTPDTEKQRAWTCDFDGHTFYVLDLGENGAVVYDITTQSWSSWSTQGYEGHFNMKNGFHWRDGKMIVGGGLLNGLVVRLEEDSYVDEDFRPVAYEVQGVLFSSSEDYVEQYNLRLVGSPGRTGLTDTVVPPVLNMIFSDDNGSTWSSPRAVTLSTDASQRIQFRSLGSFRQPGRIFKLYDSGGVKFIAYVVADVEGE